MKKIILFILTFLLLCSTAYAEDEIISVIDSRIIIDVSKPENASIPLTVAVEKDGKNVYVNSFDVTGKNYIEIELDAMTEDCSIFLGGAISVHKYLSEVTDDSVQIGDYVICGQYSGEQLIWRCINIDENGALLLCDDIIEVSVFGNDNLWKTSKAKTVLDTIEDGFGNDILFVAEVDRAHSVTDVTGNLIENFGARTQYNRYPERLENELPYRYYECERLFLPDIIDVERAAKNLGVEVIVANAAYWTETPVMEYTNFCYCIDLSGHIDIESVNREIGIRPAFYLANNIELSGEGTFNNPYILSAGDVKPYLQVTEEGMTQKITVFVKDERSDDVAVYLASYDCDDRLRFVQIVSVDACENGYTVSIDKADKLRAFLWSKSGDITPISRSITVKNRQKWIK